MPDFVASCNIRLYRYSGEPNRVVKTDYLSNFDGTVLGLDGDYIEGTFRTPLDFVHPTFYIESDKGFPWNYLRLQSTTGDYGVIYRYYFVTKVTCINFNMYEVECIEDVLTTFGDDIKKCYAFIERNEFTYNTELTDTKTVALPYTTISEKEIPNKVFNTIDTNTGWRFIVNFIDLTFETPPV